MSGARTQHGASVIVVAPDPMSLDAAIHNAPTLLSDAAKQLARVKFTFLR
jgi:hypothetical protein